MNDKFQDLLFKTGDIEINKTEMYTLTINASEYDMRQLLNRIEGAEFCIESKFMTDLKHAIKSSIGVVEDEL